jgi:hypothetical protein
MSTFKKILIVLVIAFVAIQFIPSARNQNGQISASDITKTVNVPENVLSVLKTSCYDCHSNNTSYPWYSHIQPARLVQDRHVKDGKENLNFSDFGSYSDRKKRNKLRAIGSSIEDGIMPLSSYTMMHSDAKLSPQNKALIISWAKREGENFQ